MNTDQDDHEPLEGVSRAFENARQLIGGNRRRQCQDSREDQTSGWVTEDDSFLPKGFEDVAEHDMNGPRRCSAAACDRGFDIIAADLPEADDSIGDPLVENRFEHEVVAVGYCDSYGPRAPICLRRV